MAGMSTPDQLERMEEGRRLLNTAVKYAGALIGASADPARSDLILSSRTVFIFS